MHEGEEQATLKRHGDAVVAYRETITISEQLLAGDPTNIDWPGLAGAAHEDAGDALLALGDPAAALEEFDTALSQGNAMQAANPNKAVWLFVAARTEEKVGDIQTKRGKRIEALEAYRRQRDALLRAVEVDESDTENQGALAGAYLHVGTTLDALGKPREAVEEYKSGLKVADALHAGEPTEAAWIKLERELANKLARR